MLEDHFKQVIRYECRWCHKEFRTNTKHLCRFNPELKSCFSCKYCQGIESVQREYSVPFADPVFSDELRKEVYTEEVKKIACLKGHTVYTRDIAMERNVLNCADHEVMENYEGKKTWRDRFVLKAADELEDDGIMEEM